MASGNPFGFKKKSMNKIFVLTGKITMLVKTTYWPNRYETPHNSTIVLINGIR
ncbi:hypothetical protein FEM08_07910 [Flavobacterium gilvum]|nr:hypothetical protein FEM08_07910 [Flavobacterium gilvum]